MVNSTIIIGLLVLLTLNSISTPFVEGEQSEFFSKWYETQQDLRIMDRVLLECETLLLEKEGDAFSESFVDHYFVDPADLGNYLTRPGQAIEFDEGTDPESDLYVEIKTNEWEAAYIENITARCYSLPAEKMELIKKLDELNEWGMEFCYLSGNSTKLKEGETPNKYLKYNFTNNDSANNCFNNKNSTHIVESQYHLNLASGPFITIMTNIGMIFPFLISAIVESIVGSRKKDDDASKIGAGLMVAGFIGMIIGMLIIGYSFYGASSPFLN